MKQPRQKKSRNTSKQPHQRKQSSICASTHNTQNVTARIPNPMSFTIPIKQSLNSIGSARLKSKFESNVQSKQTSKNVSRKVSIHQSGKRQAQIIGIKLLEKDSRKKEHNRSNSTISKKSTPKDIKNCFKIDISKLIQSKQQQNYDNNKINIDSNKDEKQLNRMHFTYHYIIGKGGFGKVWSVQMKKTKKIYAMKEMMKAKIINKKSIHSVLNERDLLSKLKHPFIVNMSYAFQDRQSLYLVMDLLVGGDLRYHMGRRTKFKQSQSKFFIACILVGLEFLHLNNIIHRDIKPENLVLDQKGYLRITDLGIARIMKTNNSADTSGTPGYMAPEVMCRQDHSFAVDYYAVGVIAYEFMLGRRPYYGRNRKQIRDQILSKQVQIKSEQIPVGWSSQSVDFINRMIQRKPTNRLGNQHGVTEIKEHPWFKGFPWNLLVKKSINAPFIPKNIADNVDYREQISSSSEDQNEQENMLLLRRKSVEDLFEGYTYCIKDKKINNNINLATTSNTHNSNVDQKETSRTNKPFLNNFFKGSIKDKY